MSQTETAKSVAAEERTGETRSFVRTVKAAARRKYTPEEKIRIVLKGFRREATVSDLCRREGIKPHSYYGWTKEFMGAGKERLTRDMFGPPRPSGTRPAGSTTHTAANSCGRPPRRAGPAARGTR